MGASSVYIIRIAHYYISYTGRHILIPKKVLPSAPFTSGHKCMLLHYAEVDGSVFFVSILKHGGGVVYTLQSIRIAHCNFHKGQLFSLLFFLYYYY